MEELVVMHDKTAVTTSLKVAEIFNKNHRDVLDKINSKINSAENSAQYSNMFALGSYKDKSGKSNPMYYMNRDGFSFIAFGFTGKRADNFKLQYIDAFNHMEEQIKLPTSPRELAGLALRANEETNQRLDNVEGVVKDLKENQVIPKGDYDYIASRVNKRVSEVAHGYGEVTKKQRGCLFKDINGGIKQIAGVNSRSNLRKKDYQMVVDFITDWEPSTATKMIIRQTSLDLN